MYYIKKEDWNKIPNDYKLIDIDDNKTKCCFSRTCGGFSPYLANNKMIKG